MAELLRGDVGWVRPRRSARLLAVGLVLMLLVPFGPLLLAPAAAGEYGVCYAASDGDDVLYRLDRSDATETVVGDLDATDPSATDVTALAFRGTDLFGAQDGQLGAVSTATGAYSSNGFAAFGTGTSPSGSVTFSEVVGLTTDVTADGRLYGLHRDTGADDVLFVIDPDTGAHVDDAFGSGVDHVRISGSTPDIDDLAAHPTTGVLYGVTRETSGTESIVTIDETTGTVTSALPLKVVVDGGTTHLERVEGLSFAEDGTLYATTGAGGTYPDSLFRIDLTDGTATQIGQLAAASAVSGLACLHGTSRVDGTVYRDDDDSGTRTGSEPGMDGVVVELYEDVNADGAFDTGDRLVATETTAGGGAYLFDIAATGSFLVRPDPASLPAGASVTPSDRSFGITTVGATITDQDFGVRLASIAGTVFDDGDADGVPDTGEGLGAVTVRLSGAATETTATVSDGTYRFEGLPEGDYEVAVDVPSGYEAVTALPIAFTLAAGEDMTGVDVELDRLVADLSVTKDVDDPTAQVGQTITYRIGLTNEGPDDATDVVVTDLLPDGVSNPRPAAGTPLGTHDTAAGTYTWDLGTVPVQTTATVLELLVDVDDPADAENVVDVATTAQDPDTTNDSATADLEAADLAITKTVDDPDPVADQVVTFTMVLSNAATSDEADGITVTDTLPSGLAYVSSSPTGTYDGGAHDVTWTLGSLPAGTQTTFTIDARVTSSGTHTNTVAVTAVDEHDPNPGDETASVTLSPEEADLELVKTVSDATPYAGDDVAFTISVTNHGPSDATGVTVVDTLPVGLEYVAGSGGTYDSAARTVTWTIPTIADDASVDLTFTATATFEAATGVVNHAEVTSLDQFDPGIHQNEDTVDVDAVAADVTVDLAGPAPAPNVGDTITVSVTADDLGPDPATGVTVTVILDPGLTWASDWTPPADLSIVDASTGTWDIGDLALTSTPSIDLDLDVGPSAVEGADVTATISAIEPDPDTTDDTAILPVDAQDVDLTLTKTLNDPADARPQVGDTVSFDLAVTNDSGDTATGVSVQDVLPSGLTFSSATGSGTTTYSAATGIWDIGDLGGGGVATLALTATVDGSVLTRIENTATVVAVDQYDTDPGNDTDSAELDPVDVDLQVTKSYVTASGTATRPEIGERITFTVVVTNNNDGTTTDGATATGVVTSDPPTPGLTDPQLVSVEGSVTDVDLATGTWAVGDVPAGESRTLRYSVLVDVTDLATVHEGVTNTASVTAAEHDRDDSNDSYDRFVDPFDADVSLDKQLTSGSATPQVGDQLEFTVTVTNDGPDAAPGIVVEDTLASGLTLTSTDSSAPATVATSGSVTTWSLTDPLPEARTATLTVVAEVTGDGYRGTANTAEVTAVVGNGSLTRFDPDSVPEDGTGDDHDQVVLDPRDADLRLTKTVDEATPRYGDPVSFTVTLTNDGPDAAQDVEVVDALPSTFDRSTALTTATPGSYDVDTGLWTVGDLAPSAEATLTITASTTRGGTYTNLAQVTSVLEFDPDSTPGNHATADEDDSDEVVVTVDDPASLSGVVWDDVDGDGTRDTGEDGLAGVEVTLVAVVDSTFTRTTTTDALGAYGFADLPRDDYTVTVTDPPSSPYEPSAPDPATTTVTVAAGQDLTGVGFGYWRPATISGLVWHDVDEDGAFDLGEPAAPPAPVTVELYADTAADGQPDGTALRAITVGTSDGRYTFDELPPGDYAVVVPETIDDAYVLTTDNIPHPVPDLDPAEHVTGTDFGYAAYDPVVTVTAGTSVRTEAGTTVSYAHTVTNQGNVDDTYDLTATSSQGWAVDLWEDVDGDGVLDAGDDRALSAADTGVLAKHGGTFDLLVVLTVPSGTARGIVDTLTVTATSRVDPAVEARTTDTTTVIAPRIEVDKTSSTTTGHAVPGQRIDYRIEVRNVDDGITATALDVAVDDELADPSHGTIDGTTIAVDGDTSVPDSFPVALGDLAPGDLRVITFQVVVRRPLADGTVIVNTATVTADNPEGALLTDQDSAADTVASSAIPQLSKTAVPVSGTVVDPADTITYQLVVANRSDATDTWRDVTVIDAEPDTTTDYVAGSARLNGAPVADDGTNPFATGFALGDLPPGATVTLTFDVRVHDPIADGTVIVNVAEATGSDTAPSYASVSHLVEVDPAVSLTPDRSGTVEPPATMTYAHVLRNDGDVTDTYDLTATSDHGWTAEIRHDLDGDGQVDAGDPVVRSRTLAPGGVSRLLVTVAVPAGTVSATVDTVSVVATSRTDPAVSSAAFDVTTAVTGELEVRKTADPSSSVVNPGMDVVYTIEVENVGGAPARDVVLTDDTPDSTTYAQGTTTWDDVPVPDGAAGDRNPMATANGGLDLGDLAAGATATFRFTVHVHDPLADDTLIVNVAEAVGAPDLEAADSVTQIVRSSPVFDLDKAATSPNGTVEPRERITYTLTVANLGNEAATGVVLTDPTPAGTSYVPGSTGVDGTTVADDGTSPLEPANGGLGLPDLPVGGPPVEVVFAVTVDDPVPDGTVITNEATVTSAEGVSAPSRRVRHTVSATPGVTVGPDRSSDVVIPGVAVYAHDVTNTGNVTDTYGLDATSSEGWTTTLYADVDGDGQWDSTTETTAVASTGPVPPDGRFPLIAVVDVPADAVAGTVDTTTVRAGSTADPAVDDAATDRTRAVAPALRITKNATPSGDQVNAGQVITYAVTVRNVGGAPATGVVVVDDTPQDTSYVPGSATVGTTSIADATGSDPNPFSTAAGGYAVGELPGEGTVNIGFEVRVSTTVAVGTDIVNTATATADHTAEPDRSTRIHTVTSGPVLDLQKSADPAPRGPVTAGERITYEVEVRNVGQETATGVRVTDDTPIDTVYVEGSATVDGVPLPDGPLDPNPFSSQYAGHALGDLPPDGTVTTVGFAVDVVDPVPDGGTITNVATAASAEDATAQTPLVEHDVDVHPAVTLAPDGTRAVLAGGTAVHPLTVTNTGDVTDVYSFSGDSSRGWTLVLRADPDGDGQVDAGEPEIAATGSLAPGASYATTLSVTAPTGTPAGTTDTAVVRATSTSDGTVDDEATLTTRVVAGRLGLTKSASPQTVTPGSRTTYTLTVENEGDARITDVVLTDATPAGTTYVRGSTRRDGTSVADRTGGDGNPLETGLTLGALDPGDRTVVTFEVDVAEDTDLEVVVNVAQVTAADAVSDRAGTTQPVSRSHGLDLAPPGEEEVRSGPAVHAHTLTNIGDLDDEVLVSATSDLGFPVVVHRDTDGDGRLDDTDPVLAGPVALAPGASTGLLVVVTVPDGTPGGTEDVTTVTASSLGDPGVVVSVEDVTRVVAPALVITKEVDPNVSAAPGTELTFTIRVANDGNAGARDLVVTDPTPAGTTYVPGSTTVDGTSVPDAETDTGADATSDPTAPDANPLDDRNGGVGIAALDPGDEVVLRFRSVVRDQVVSGTELSNVAFVTSPETGMLASPVVSVQILGSSSLAVAKGVDAPGMVTVGTVITWAVQVTNLSTETAAEVTVTDDLPIGVAYLPGTTTLDGQPVIDVDGGITGSGVPIGPVAAGATRLVTFQTVTTGDAELIENVAVATHGASGAAVLSNAVLLGVSGAGFGADPFPSALPQTGAPVSRTLGTGLLLALTGWSLLFVARREDPPQPVSRPRRARRR